MILSFSRNFVFIKGLKVAGTSIEMALASICADQDIITPITPRDELARIRRGRGCQNYGHSRAEQMAYIELVKADYRLVRFPLSRFFNHMSYQRLAGMLRSPLDSFLYVCAERNPYHKILSLIGYESNRINYNRGLGCAGSIDSIRENIDAYIETGRIARVFNIANYQGENGRMPDVVLRHESLARDFSLLMERLGLPQNITLPHAKKGLQVNAFDPAEIFRKDQLKKINKMFFPEFLAFGYDMIHECCAP